MRAIRCFVGGMAGAMVGAAAWAAVSYFTGFEIGWIAWAVGVLCGAGVAAGTGPAPLPRVVRGSIAAGVAVFGVAMGKFVSFQLQINHHADEMRAQLSTVTDEHATALLASRLAEQREQQGQQLAWPEHKAGASPAAAFPKDVWTDAARQLRAMSAAERNKLREDVRDQGEAQINDLRAWGSGPGFVASFSAFDALWTLLALGSAYRVGGAARAARPRVPDLESSAMHMSPLSRVSPKASEHPGAVPEAEQSKAA